MIILNYSAPTSTMRYIHNLKGNLIVIISALAFYLLHYRISPESNYNLCISSLTVICIGCLIPPSYTHLHNKCIIMHIIAMLTAIGVCWRAKLAFFWYWRASERVKLLQDIFTTHADVELLSMFLFLIAFPFIYYSTLYFWHLLFKLIRDSDIFNGIEKREYFIYATILLLFLLFSINAFSKSIAFYGVNKYDIIYTSDSMMVRRQIYISLLDPENDIRQPLFAVFSTPFIGLPYLLSILAGASLPIQAIFMNSVQILLLLVANFILTKSMRLSPSKRILFILLSSCTYTQLLFSVMMEQYVIAYFWLIICIYLICTNTRTSATFCFVAASGTLITSSLLLPYLSYCSSRKTIRDWLSINIKNAFSFLSVLFLFYRFDIIYNLVHRLSFLSRFADYRLSFTHKFFQFSSYLHNIFLAPNASAIGFGKGAQKFMAWRLNAITEVNPIGIIILFLIFMSALINRKDKSCIVSILWFSFSVLTLLGAGWGTRENGLILYSLYFGWPCVVLIFKLFENLEVHTKQKNLTCICCCACIFIMLLFNIPAIGHLLNFSFKYYPVK